MCTRAEHGVDTDRCTIDQASVDDRNEECRYYGGLRRVSPDNRNYETYRQSEPARVQAEDVLNGTADHIYGTSRS